MGRPFSTELDSLSHTYDWATREPVEGLVRAVRAASGLPLLGVGSGGSFTAAHLVCEFHRRYTRNVAQALSPMQMVGSTTRLRNLAVFLPSAGGNNPDVLGAFRHLVAEEPRCLLVWCANPDSRLSAAAAKLRFVDLHDFALPSGKDGFLAMNSLVAFAVLFARAYAGAVGSEAMPGSFDDLLAGEDWLAADAVDRRCEGLWGRQTLVVLHGPSTLPAAIDVESKFTEAALGSVQVADYRQFAHGRHHWIAKRRPETAVLAITCNDDRAVAGPLLNLLPADVPVLRVDVPYSGCVAAVSAMARCFFLVSSAGRARGIDPGDPGVPAFGRRIYHLNAYGNHSSTPCDLPQEELTAIERKAGERVSDLARTGRLVFWRDAYETGRRALAEAAYCGIVLDYDGTLCHEAERYGPLPEKMAAELSRLLRSGAFVGIATGRGKSVRKSLQEALPERLWKRVVIGYYNGAEVGMLADDACPDDREEPGPELLLAAERLRADGSLAALARFTFKLRQITLTPADGVFPGPLWEHVHSLLLATPSAGAVALRSGHSVDVIGQSTTKLTVVERVRQLAGVADGPVLRIGDRARWPGNDFALLASPHALSADEVSPAPDSAWNFAPAGHRGAQATLGYLRQLSSTRGTLRLANKSVRRNGQ